MGVELRMASNLPVGETEAIHIARLVIRPPEEMTEQEMIHRLFGAEYLPGTFILAERTAKPAFLTYENEGSYEEWIRAMTRSHLEALASSQLVPHQIDPGIATAIEDAILVVLDAPLESGLTLSQTITNQQATDIVWRILKTLLTGNAYGSYHVSRDFNELARRYAIGILRRDGPTDPVAALKFSVVVGAGGVDIKSRYSAAGPSPLVGRAIIRFLVDPGKRALDSVREELESRAATELGIDCTHDFCRDVLSAPGRVSLLFFTDDYFETVFDLWSIQILLRAKQDLKVTLVPKWGQHANDASFHDVAELLNEPLFAHLRAARPRNFHVAAHGPAGSGISAYELSPEILEALAAADIVLFKGARSYEMLQGIRKTAYFAFNVLHSYTETLTGLDATDCPSVFVRQEAGLPSFDDFRYRAQRRLKLPTGRVIGLARMTAQEYVKAVQSKEYARLVNEGRSRDAVNLAIMERAKTSHRTFAQLVADNGFLPTTLMK